MTKVGHTRPETVSPSSQDRRIVKSKKALRSALISLMETKGFEAITVNDLCSAADLNRGTFYNHFSDKEDLLATLEDEVMDDISRIQSEMGTLAVRDVMAYCVAKKPLPFLITLFDYLREQGDFFHAVLGPGGDSRFGSRLRDSVCTNLIQGVLHEKYRNDPDPFVGYYLSFYASAYLGVITRWIETGMKEDSEQMARIAMRLLFIKPGEPIRL
ncbi:MAG TPA: TetR/AcrR family transcriptional regulator [Eggerthellaceae bacterium]|nr:TetR/AcrR family transcriptional regulator [Eggerthellaceae bacterium]